MRRATTGPPFAPKIVQRTNFVVPISGASSRINWRCGSVAANADSAASSRHTDRVAYCLRSGRASSEKPMRPSAESSCFPTDRDPRNNRHVDRRLRGGIINASTTYSASGSRVADDFQGDFIGVRFLRGRVVRRAGESNRTGADGSDPLASSLIVGFALRTERPSDDGRPPGDPGHPHSWTGQQSLHPFGVLPLVDGIWLELGGVWFQDIGNGCPETWKRSIQRSRGAAGERGGCPRPGW